MNVATISEPAADAAERLREYRDGLAGREPTDEDKGIILGLQALAKGKSLIDLHQVFRDCPPDAKGRPAFAVARAHWRHVRLDRTQAGSARFYQGTDYTPSYTRVAWHKRIMLPAGTIPVALRGSGGSQSELRAVVPLIPPNLRPAKALHRYCILFEAEWEPVPPKDPLLIRQIHGSLYVVLAAWDLTELERAVLAGRLSER